MLWLILSIVLGGFVVGALGRLAVPGPDPMPWWLTVLIGWGGSVLGGGVSAVFLGHVGGIVFAIAGAAVLVILYRRLVQHRPITGPGARVPPRRGL